MRHVRSIAKLIAFGLLGVSFGSYVPLIATMIVMSFLGTWVGKHAMDRIPERVFRTGFQVLLTLLGFRLVWLAADASFNLN